MGDFLKVTLGILIALLFVGLVAAQLELSAWYSGRISGLEARNEAGLQKIEALGNKEAAIEAARSELIERLRNQSQQLAALRSQEDVASTPAPDTSAFAGDLAALDNQTQALRDQQLALEKQLAARADIQKVAKTATQVTQAS